ncbi:MAG: AbrB/MazE/SpoVT family DNA-binding domain-containing protein [Candidatus Rokubacteria bacterium]|nr:AbrB/MazE/SpoVT family DNA-binding domain-containing protein [Candidatus Rokubacteria bacterium]
MTVTKSVRLSRKGQLVIPKEMRDALGMKEGDDVLIILEDGRMLVTTPREYARATRGLMKGTWGKTRREVDAYLERERESWR